MQSHTSLEAWREARRVVLEVLDFSRTGWRPWAGAVFHQLQRASLSVQLNIAEGYARGPGRSAAYFYNVAYGSAVETGDLLGLLSDAALADVGQAAPMIQRNRRCQALVLGLLKRAGEQE